MDDASELRFGDGERQGPSPPSACAVRRGPASTAVCAARPTPCLAADFNEATMLLNTEVAVILKQMIMQRREDRTPGVEQLQGVLDHVNRFDLMKGDPARVANLRSAYTTHEFDQLAEFEFVQIVNLGCDDVDEVKTLIPSLKKKIEHGGDASLLDDDRLQSIIYTVAKERTFDDNVAQL